MYAHAKELAPNLLGEDPNDISRLSPSCCGPAPAWDARPDDAGDRAVRHRPWDMKAKRATLPLAKLLGAQRDSAQCYNTSGGYLHTPLDQVLKNVAISRESGIGGIKLKVGQPDLYRRRTRRRCAQAARRRLPADGRRDQHWDRQKATVHAARFEGFDLTWIEEPLDAHDFEGHASLAAALRHPHRDGRDAHSFDEHAQLIFARHRFHPTRRPAGRWHHAVPAHHGAGRVQATQARAALRDGDPPTPRGRLLASSPGSSTSMARPDVQRADAPQGRTHARARPAGARLLVERAGAPLDRGNAGAGKQP